MRIVNRIEGGYSGNKHFHFPVSVFDNCPKCGLEIEKDFMEDYLNEPSFNSAEDVNFYCWKRGPREEDDLGCAHEWTEQIVLRVTAEAVPEED